MELSDNRLKLFLCFIIFIMETQSLTVEQTQKIYTWSRDCKMQSGISKETIFKVRAGEPIDNPYVRKQVLCVAQYAGFIDKEGNFNEALIQEKLQDVILDEDIVKKIMAKCVVKLRTPEETALQGFHCLHDNAPNFSYA